MKKLLMFLIFVVFSFFSNLYASEIVIEGVPWISQLDTANGMGTDWTNTMNCGPTSVVILSAYIRNFTPTTDKIKKFDNWLVKNYLVSSINNYNLPKSGVSHWALRSGAAYYFGLWNSHYYRTMTTTKDSQINLIRNSISNGTPSIIGVKTKMSTTGASHWMVAIGLKDINNDGDYMDDFDEILVSDPGRSTEYLADGSGKGRKWYTIAELKAVLFGSIIFEDTYDVGEYNDLYLWHNEDEYSDWDDDIFEYRPSQAFVDYYLNAGIGSESQISGVDLFGVPINNVDLFPVGYVNNYRFIHQTWIQSYFNAATGDNYLFVHNPVINADNSIYKGSVFSIQGRLRDYWVENYWMLGYPVTNEYHEEHNGQIYAIQWFIDGAGGKTPIAYNLNSGMFNDFDTSILDIGNRIIEHINVNCGYSKEGFGIGGGGEEEPDPPATEDYTINRTATSRDVDLDYPWLPIDETAFFSVNDGDDQVHSWIQFDDISKMDWAFFYLKN